VAVSLCILCKRPPDDLVPSPKGRRFAAAQVLGAERGDEHAMQALDTTDYYQIRESNEVQNMLKAFLDDKNILLVRSEDPNLDGPLKWAAERQKNIHARPLECANSRIRLLSMYSSWFRYSG
jgi:hypothetical protein